jgi:uncharacterized protein YbjT (DUF2867 family)
MTSQRLQQASCSAGHGLDLPARAALRRPDAEPGSRGRAETPRKPRPSSRNDTWQRIHSCICSSSAAAPVPQRASLRQPAAGQGVEHGQTRDVSNNILPKGDNETMTVSEATEGQILVTGASGLAGSAVIREFVRSSYPVRALVRDRAGAPPFEAFPTVEAVDGDMLRPETLTEALSGVERVLLISSSDQRMAETQSTVIDAAKNSSVRHIVKFSGLSAADVGSPFIFGSMHADIESYLERSGLSWTHLRPSQFMTEYLREVPTILGQGALFLPLKDAKLVPVDVADIAKAAYLLLTTPGHEGKIYAMSGPEALSMDEIAEQISLAVGRTVRYVSISREERAQALLAAGVPSFFVDALDIQAGERLKGTEAIVHSETHTALGISPTSFAEFARRNAGAFLGESGYVGLK